MDNRCISSSTEPRGSVSSQNQAHPIWTSNVYRHSGLFVRHSTEVPTLTSDNENGEAKPEVKSSNSEPDVLHTADRVQLGDFTRGPEQGVPKREDVEPYLAALLQAEHLNLLVGSGLTTALAKLAKFNDGADMNAKLEIADDKCAEAIEEAAKSSAQQLGRGKPNIEDRLRVAILAAEGLTTLRDNRADALIDGIAAALNDLLSAVSKTETALAKKREESVAEEMTLQGLLMSFLGSFAGRVPTRDRLHVFTTNYDRVIEWGAELAGLRIVDRFVGSLNPIFRSSRLEVDYHYSPPGTVRDPRHLDGVFRLTKLHGSLDWQWDNERRRIIRSALPFGQTPTDPEQPPTECEEAPTDPEQAPTAKAPRTIIYPNAAKDFETSFYPYADLFRDFAAAICRPHSVLVTYGYGFGDDHINRTIKDMLTIPSTHLLIISWDDPSERIGKFIEGHQRAGQISQMIGREFTGLPSLVEKWLPWPSAEFLLQRRAEIFRNRDAGSND